MNRNSNGVFPFFLRTIVLFSVCLGISLSSASHAADIADTEAQRQQARQQAQEQAERAQQPQVILPGRAERGVAPLPLPVESPCFNLSSIQLEGDRASSFASLAPLLDRYLGQCVGQRGLNIILKEAGNRILAQGYTTTRVTLPPQNLALGKLVLHVTPGLIGGVRVVGNDGQPADIGDWRNAFPFRAGDLLNLRDLEQGLEQIKRLPSVDADIRIEPGGHPGESIIVVILAHAKPWRVSASLDNSGQRATGKLQAGLNLALDNPTGHFDQLTFGVNNDTHSTSNYQGTHSNSLGYNLPWGNWLISTSLSDSHYHQTIPGINQSFTSSGQSQNFELKLQRLLRRDQTSKTSLQARLLKRWSKSYINDTEIMVQRRDTTAAELALIHRQYIGPAQIDVQLAQRQGVSWLGGQEDQQHDPSAPTFAYTLRTLDLGLTTPLPRNMRYSVQFHGQSSSDVLYATDYMAIGNRWTVRGYDGEYTLAAEQGWTLRNDLEFAHMGQGVFYLALDAGQVHGNAPLPGRTLTGGGLGLRGQQGAAFYDLFIGAPIVHPSGFPGGPIGYFLIGYQL